MQKTIGVIETIKDVVSSIWIWIVSWWVWGLTAHLYEYSKTRQFDFIMIMLSMIFWAFAWFIASDFTDSWALTGMAWAMSMKIFDVISSSWTQILTQVMEQKLWIKVDKSNKSNKK